MTFPDKECSNHFKLTFKATPEHPWFAQPEQLKKSKKKNPENIADDLTLLINSLVVAAGRWGFTSQLKSTRNESQLIVTQTGEDVVELINFYKLAIKLVLDAPTVNKIEFTYEKFIYENS